MMRSIVFSAMTLALFAGNAVAWQDYKQPVMDAETRLAWHEQHLEMREASDFNGTKWRFIGPELMSGNGIRRCLENDERGNNVGTDL